MEAIGYLVALGTCTVAFGAGTTDDEWTWWQLAAFVSAVVITLEFAWR